VDDEDFAAEFAEVDGFCLFGIEFLGYGHNENQSLQGIYRFLVLC
jgi:hypothetical protein